MADTSTPGFGADVAGACARTAAGNRRNERAIPIFMVIPTEDSDFSASTRSRSAGGLIQAGLRFEERGQLAGSVRNGDDLNRLRLPHVAHDLGIEVPEPIAAVEKLLVIVADA